MSTHCVGSVSISAPSVRLHHARRHPAAAIEEDGDMPKYLMMIVEDEAPYFEDEAAGAKILGGEALQPRATATFLRGTRTADVRAVDNPAPDLKEVVGGYY